MKLLILDSTTKSLKAVLSANVTSTQPDFAVAWADNNGSDFTEGSTDGVLNNTTDITLVSAPASSTRRLVRNIFIYNKDTASVTVTLKYDNNGTQRVFRKITLAAGETYTFKD
jgi:hypothetical protein